LNAAEELEGRPALASPDRKTLRVFSRPARGNREVNPYTYLLCEALAEQGCMVEDFSLRRGLLGKPDIVHIHWPQSQVLGSLPAALKNLLWWIARLTVQYLRGTTIVWTVHNIRGHDRNHPGLEAVLMWVTTHLVSGLVFLGPSSRAAALERWPVLASKPSVIIPHGLYGIPNGAATSQRQAREALGIESAATMIGFIGDIKPYKGLDALLQAFGGLRPGDASLLVAGRFLAPDEYAEAQRRSISELRAAGHRVWFLERRLDDREMADAIRACDINALPYRQVTNSGLAVLTLELGGRILASDAGAFRELQDELGPEWVMCVVGAWSADVLRKALSAEAPSAGRMEAFRQNRGWTTIAGQTASFYRMLLRQGRPAGAEP
jgi:glycosyltransferase involved in cell wall biosynthesis